ncbi:hypothetical protein GCM10009809_26940 [Isoptericola hypogeus]|uniref:DUF2516 family protein n=1 Tax=Isoptericola hypogeus TaxID=300179 RepID=A0ABN2JK44_9MICO
MLGSLQFLVLATLAVVVFVVQLVAFVDGARRPAKAYVSEGKLTKNIWLLILGIAAVIGFLGLPPNLWTATSFFNVIATAPAIIYWVDVRPRILPYGTGGGRRPQGPTGGW